MSEKTFAEKMETIGRNLPCLFNAGYQMGIDIVDEKISEAVDELTNGANGAIRALAILNAAFENDEDFAAAVAKELSVLNKLKQMLAGLEDCDYTGATGMRAFRILGKSGVDGGEGTYTLDSTEGLEVGDVYSVFLTAEDENLGKITAVDSENNIVTVDIWSGREMCDEGEIQEEPWKNTFFVDKKPEIGTIDIGIGAAAFGYKTHAGKIGAISAGWRTNANNFHSAAFGKDTEAGWASIAAGNNNKILGDASFGIGHHNKEDGSGNLITGYNNEAHGRYSIIGGLRTVSSRDCQLVIGYYNVDDKNQLIILGSGTSDADRKNVFTVSGVGDGYFAGKLKVGANKDEVALKKDLLELPGRATGVNDTGAVFNDYSNNEASSNAIAGGTGSKAYGTCSLAMGIETIVGTGGFKYAHRVLAGEAVATNGWQLHLGGGDISENVGKARYAVVKIRYNSIGGNPGHIRYSTSTAASAGRLGGDYQGAAYTGGWDIFVIDLSAHKNDTQGYIANPDGTYTLTSARIVASSGAWAEGESVDVAYMAFIESLDDLKNVVTEETCTLVGPGANDSRVINTLRGGNNAGDIIVFGPEAFITGGGNLAHGTIKDDDPKTKAASALGIGTRATAEAQVAIGKYNDTDADALLIVGNGTSDSERSNAFVVKKDGAAYLGDKKVLVEGDSAGGGGNITYKLSKAGYTITLTGSDGSTSSVYDSFGSGGDGNTRYHLTQDGNSFTLTNSDNNEKETVTVDAYTREEIDAKTIESISATDAAGKVILLISHNTDGQNDDYVHLNAYTADKVDEMLAGLATDLAMHVYDGVTAKWGKLVQLGHHGRYADDPISFTMPPNPVENLVDLTVEDSLTANTVGAYEMSATQIYAGTISADRVVTSGAGLTEMYEWQDGNVNGEDRRGLFITLEGNKIRIADESDRYILGVIDPNASVVCDAAGAYWKDKYLKDIFGSYIYEDVQVPAVLDDDGNVVKEAHIRKQKVLNPEYDESLDYVPRPDRKEFAAITAKGKVVMIDDGTCQVNGYATVGVGGVATYSPDNFAVRVLERIDSSHIRVLIDSVFVR